MTDPAADALLERIVAQLADGRAHTFDELFDALAEHLPEDGHEAEHALAHAIDRPRFATLDDERWLDLHPLLAGRRFTHRLTAAEAAAGIVAIQPDLDLPLLPFGTDIPFAGGGAGDVVFPDEEGADLPDELAAALHGGGLRGPGGWLDGIAPGQVLTLELRDGAIAVGPLDAEPPAAVAAVEALARAFTELTDPDGDTTDLIALQLQWILDEPDALGTPHGPLGELVTAAGLDIRGDWVGLRGSGWMTPFERVAVHRRAFNEEVFAFDGCCHDALALAEAAFEGRVEHASPADVAHALSHGQVAEAFTAGFLGRGAGEDELNDVLDFTGHVVAAARDADLAGPRYVESIALECLGETIDAEDAARAALRADPGHPGANEALAEYLDARGDAARALEHLRRAGVAGDDHHAVRLTAVLQSAAPKAGRNDPCPCGSGRKYKACCIDTPRLPADTRFAWLYDKALIYAGGISRRPVVAHLAGHALRAAGSDDSPSVRAVADVRLTELALFDDGLLRDFIDARGPLLPPGEVDLATSWLDRPLTVLEVLGTGQEGLQLSDRRTGDRAWVDGARAGDGVETGDLLVARLLPDGERLRLGGPVLPIPPALRDTALEVAGDPDSGACEWAEWIGASDAALGAGAA